MGSVVFAAKDTEWTKKMKELSKVLTSVVSESSKDKLTPSDDKKLKSQLKRLSELASEIKEHQKTMGEIAVPDWDPSIDILAGMFQRDTKRAYEVYADGNKAYAKGLIKNITGYCISCHTRNNMGPSFATGGEIKNANLSPLEKADWLAATRKFDSAKTEYLKVIDSDEMMKKRSIEWQRAVRQYMIISLRTQKGKDQVASTWEVLQKIVKKPGIPEFFKENVNSWSSSLEKWKNEPEINITTEEGLFQQMLKVAAEARAMQAYPADPSADVIYLRASGLAHEYLSKYKDPAHQAEALFVIATSYEVLELFF
jgi:mono/diheme cytochrome c family protein